MHLDIIQKDRHTYMKKDRNLGPTNRSHQGRVLGSLAMTCKEFNSEHSHSTYRWSSISYYFLYCNKRNVKFTLVTKKLESAGSLCGHTGKLDHDFK